MSSRRHRTADHDHADHRAGAGPAPGKRTLTSALPPPRDTADFFRVGDYRESRATIDGTPTESRLSDAQLRRACERNPHWQAKLGFTPELFGGGDVTTGEFAENVAAKQASLGLPVDGIAGPRTFEALTGIAPPAAEDPYAMHLLEDRGPARATPAPAAATPAAAPAAAAPAEKRLRADVTDLQPTDDGVQVVVGAGANHGVDESWHVHLLGTNLPWEITEVRATATVATTPHAHVESVLGLTKATLTGIPRTRPLETADTPDPAWWTFED